MTNKSLVTKLTISSAIAISSLSGAMQSLATDQTSLNKKVNYEQSTQLKDISASVYIPQAQSIVKVSSPTTYKVKAGDTLSQIAAKYGMTYSKLMKMNNLSSTMIFVGQTLKLNDKSVKTPASSSSSNTSKSTYKVKAGDTLGKIAAQYGTTYTNIMKLNNLSSTVIYIGQNLKVSGKASISTNNTNTSNTTSTTSTSSYKVKAGDTLSKIAAQHGTNYSQLMKLNNLSSTMIFVGQTLKISGSTSSNITQVSNKVPTNSTSTKLAVATKAAMAQIGVPYVFGGGSSSGFDCSGLIHYALKKAGYDYGRTTAAGYYSLGKKVTTPQYGDLVFFKNTYKAGISHVGFYIGNGKMISASGDKVQVSDINDRYWSSHFAGYKRL